MNCPKCETECERDEVDVGVGIVYGPWGCASCYWSENPKYDFSDGRSNVTEEGTWDQFGGLWPNRCPECWENYEQESE